MFLDRNVKRNLLITFSKKELLLWIHVADFNTSNLYWEAISKDSVMNL